MASGPLFLGVDLGQAMDFTALAILEKEPLLDDAGREVCDGRNFPIAAYTVVHLERYPLNSSYPALVAAVKALVARPEVQSRERPRLGIDATGVGRAVVDQFLGAGIEAELVPITITSGAGVTKDLWNKTAVTCYRVAKLDLVAAVRVGLDAGRLKIVPSLALASTLTKELTTYQVKVTASANETFNARVGQHDDLVLAVALAAWLGENYPASNSSYSAGGRPRWMDTVNPTMPWWIPGDGYRGGFGGRPGLGGW